MRRPLFAFLLGSAACVPAFAQPLEVPSDPRARYEVLSVTKRGEMREILTRRDGPSGTSFSLREVDCSSMTSRYLGTGDTLKDARDRKGQEGRLGPLFPGSISDVVSRHACRR